MTTSNTLLTYFALGFQHILPLGLDHILFIACVFFRSPRLTTVILQASVFTLAHSLTLGLAMYGLIHPISSIIEPLIAISILVLAIENFYGRRVGAWRVGLIFIFGLVHGMGFAGELSELGLPAKTFATALFGFNAGVEAGQIAVIALMTLAVAKWPKTSSSYRTWVVRPASLAIALAAAFMTLARL